MHIALYSGLVMKSPRGIGRPVSERTQGHARPSRFQYSEISARLAHESVLRVSSTGGRAFRNGFAQQPTRDV